MSTNPIVTPWLPGEGTQMSAAVAPRQGNELDRDAFLRLLIVQLQHQDPLNPMDDRDFIAQMAQFSALEQMQNMNAAYRQSQAYNMIGRQVEGLIQEGAMFHQVEGIVTGVVTLAGEPHLIVRTATGEVTMEMSRVEVVHDEVIRNMLLENINLNIANQQSLAMIGQFVQVILRDEDNNPAEYLEGRVSSARFTPYGILLTIGNREVSPAEVVAVGGASVNSMIIGREVYAEMRNPDTGNMELVPGTITDVRFTGGGVSVVMRGADGNEIRVPIDNLTGLTQTLAKVENGTWISLVRDSGIYQAMVTGVVLRGGNVAMNTDVGMVNWNAPTWRTTATPSNGGNSTADGSDGNGSTDPADGADAADA